MSSKQLQVNRSGRQQHAAWSMSQCSDKWSVQYEMGMFCFSFCKISCVEKLKVERQTGLQPESNQNQRIHGKKDMIARPVVDSIDSICLNGQL